MEARFIRTRSIRESIICWKQGDSR
jgi:hypothetical protein